MECKGYLYIYSCLNSKEELFTVVDMEKRELSTLEIQDRLKGILVENMTMKSAMLRKVVEIKDEDW